MLVVVLVVVMILLAGCGEEPATINFVPLPPPVDGRYPLSYQFVGLGNENQLQRLISPNIRVEYGETSGGIGGVANEMVTIFPQNLSAVMQEIQWGDWFNGRIRRTEYYAANGDLLGGMVLLNVPKSSFLQLFRGEIRYTIDRSRLYLVYVAPERGARPVLTKIVYMEYWGPTDRDRWAMGLNATWMNVNVISSTYHRWGFWETSADPFSQVVQALENARQALNQTQPDLLSVDEDSAREILGRQTGLRLYQSGQAFGTIEFEYNQLFGRQPNTMLIGNGALSRVDWNLAVGNYTLLVLTPQVSPVPSTLYVFLANPKKADEFRATAWPTLYERLRRGDDPNVILAVHAIGDLGKITASGTTSEGKSATVNVGTGGGINYAVLGSPTYDQVTKARRLLSLLGQGGIRAIGLYYPYAPGSGSGLDFYLATLELVTAPPERVLNEWGMDVGVLDRVGFPEIP